MLKHKLFLFIYFCLAVIIFSQEQENKIHYTREIILSGKNEYKEIVLDKDVITKAARDLSDLRIVDENQNNVPYFIYNSQSYLNMNETSFASKFLTSFIKQEDNEEEVFEYFDFAILQEENSDAAHQDVVRQDVAHQDVYGNQLKLEMNNSGFAENVEVFGSHDGINWTFVMDAFIYDVSEVAQKTIVFSQMEKYSFYRIKAKEKTLQINALFLSYTQISENKELFTKDFYPRFSIEEKDKNSGLH
jgi:hypothetical protein